MADEVTDRKEMLRAAWNAAAAEAEPDETPAEPTEEPAAEPEEPAAEPAQEPQEGAGEAQQPQAGRDDKGRFTAQQKASQEPAKPPTAAAKPATQPATEQKPAAQQAPASKPPQSWTAAEREVWGKLPAEAQRAVMRREQETAKAFQENAQLRRAVGELDQRFQQETGFRQQVSGLLSPLAGVFSAQGLDPMQGAANVLQSYAALTLGSRQQKAGLLAQLIDQFSSVDDVNSILSGQVQAPQPYRQPMPPPQAQQPVNVEDAINKAIEARLSAAQEARADLDWTEYQKTSPEFLDHPGVQENMQMILDSTHARGRNLTYPQAYDFALKMDPEIQGILQQRAQAAAVAAPNAQASTARARAAAATVRSKPAGPAGVVADPKDRRAMLQAAMERQRS